MFGAEPGAVPALGVESLADAGLDEEELGILGESAGLLGNCGISDTMLLIHTQIKHNSQLSVAYSPLITKCNMTTSKRER